MKNFTHEPTKHKDLFRNVDREGNWSEYFHKPTNTYLRSVTSILDEGYAKGFGMTQWLLSKTKEEADKILRTTGDRGDSVHQFIDNMLTHSKKGNSTFSRDYGVQDKESGLMKKLDNDAWDCVLAFSNFWNAHDPKLIISEYPVFDLKLGYAGTFDAILILGKACEVKTCPCKDLVGKIGVFDWKTSSGIWPSYEAQLASYAKAESIKKILKTKKVEYTANLRLGTNHKIGYEFKPYTDIDSGFERFLAAKKIADVGYKPFTETDIVEIPDEVEIIVKKATIKTKKQTKKNETKI